MNRLSLKKSAVFALIIMSQTTSASINVNAQALSPMKQMITSYSDQFAVKVYPKNPYSHRIRMEVKVYDENFHLTPARVSPKTMMMGAGSTRQVTVIVPFSGEKQKRVRICAESIPFTNQATLVKAQVCGRFIALRAN